MKYLVLSLICALVGIQMCQAACPPTPTAMTSFNENNFVKQWYVVGSSQALPTGVICLKYTVKNFTTTTKQFDFDYLLATSWKAYNTTAGKWVETTIGTADLAESIPATATVGKNWIVVATDYTSYAVLYNCVAGSIVNTETYYLLSTNPTGYTAAKTAAGTNIPTGMAMNTLNNNCPTGQKLKDFINKIKTSG